MLYAEQRMGRQMDGAHTYRTAGQDELRAEDRYFATRPGTILLVNYQLTSRDNVGVTGYDVLRNGTSSAPRRRAPSSTQPRPRVGPTGTPSGPATRRPT
jgi:hypothetical protein